MNVADEDFQQLLETLDPTTRTLVAEVDLGGQAREFLASDLGRHLVGCLQQEVNFAQSDLNKTASWRRRKIQDLQNRVWRAQFMLAWLRDLILSGKTADGALREVDHGN